MRASNSRFPITPDEAMAFHRDGWLLLPGFLTEAELLPLEAIYQRFLRREFPVRGRDDCDMSGTYGTAPDRAALRNILLPRTYCPELRDNIYERRAADVAAQLLGSDLELDYDQLVAKPPHQPDAVFHWHQDLGYWPVTEDTRTATFWLALDDCGEDNGCVRFVDGSHREPELRPHRPLLGSREQNHTLVADVDPDRDRIRSAVMPRGSVTVHHERTVHGSAGNRSDRWRRGYVVAFRSRATIAAERAMGFTHSHNDAADVLTWITRQNQKQKRTEA